MAQNTNSRKFLQIVEENFLLQVLEEPIRKAVLLNLVLTNQEGLVEDIKVGGSPEDVPVQPALGDLALQGGCTR